MSKEECIASMPRLLKIGAYDWTVRVFGEGDEYCGLTDFITFEISLWHNNLASAGQIVGVLLHECLHVVYHYGGLIQMKRSKDDREEQVIMAFEMGLVSLFRDNPKLLTWFNRWLSACQDS
jgi:hypothetical protein